MKASLGFMAVLLAAQLGLQLHNFLRPAPAQAFARWEYKIVSPKDEGFSASMQTLGADGWELVSARRASSGGPIEKAEMSYEMIFKRPAR